MDFANKKCLIAFYSRRGQNYRGGRVVDLKIGNTEAVAKMIQQTAGGELFHIEAVKPYPKDYTETTEVAKTELRDKARPALAGKVTDFSAYEVIFVGYPNWWGTAPMPVFTFLESYDFSGKIIIPFCTHEGSGLGRSEKDIAAACPDAKVQKGIAIHGSSAEDAMSSVTTWLKSL